MSWTRRRLVLQVAVLIAVGTLMPAKRAAAAEAAQGTFHVTLGDSFACGGGGTGGGLIADLVYDDKTFHIPMPPGNNMLIINFSEIGNVTLTGGINCVFDEGGSFTVTGDNDDGDFHWTEMTGEYLDHKPGISEGDPFPFVGTARCTTERTDDFKTLCDNFEFSFNGLAKALAPNPWYRDYDGDFTFRAVHRAPVDQGSVVDVQAPVDGPTGDIPAVQVTFEKGVSAPGKLRVATLADAHGQLPAGVDFPVRGTTTINHGSGPVPFFAGGDERFVEIQTDAAFNTAAKVCLPMPAAADPADIRPVRLLHGEGSDIVSRKFVDRTSSVDPKSGQVCAKVRSFSKFAVVTTDVCGNGQTQSDGLLTVAAGLIGRRTVVVDGLTDCTQYPANLPSGLARFCVPDADPAAGQCGVRITLGVNRAGCNRSAQPSTWVGVISYSGELGRGAYHQGLTAGFGPLISALQSPVEATVGPVDVTVPVSSQIATYSLKQQLTGWRPQTSRLETDKDVLKIQCVDPTQY